MNSAILKAVIFLLKNPKIAKKILFGLLLLLILVLFIPAIIVSGIVNAFTLSGDPDGVVKSYKDFGTKYHADWSDVLIFDYVRSDADLETVDKEVSLDWFTSYDIERTITVPKDSSSPHPNVYGTTPAPASSPEVETRTEIVGHVKGTEARQMAYSVASPKPASADKLSQDKIESLLNSKVAAPNDRYIRRSVGLEQAMDDYGFDQTQRDWVATLQESFQDMFPELFDGSPGSYKPPSGFAFVWPTPDLPDVSSPFGWRILDGKQNNHPGVDLNAPGESDYGKPVYAPADGEVTQVYDQDSGSCGRYVRLLHSEGYQTRYCHLSRILVSEGAKLKQGDKFALVGHSGGAEGSHLHFEMKVQGALVDPLPYIIATRPRR
jgi:murein DD-endopeptidase MepM/ murein hydrolase activator NlpD